MPYNSKSAAVPFVNQKGERSMKKVKVERYVAGKKPAYAKDEDEEYYTTDDEEEAVEVEESDEEESRANEGEEDEEERTPRKVAHDGRLHETGPTEDEKLSTNKWTASITTFDEDDDDDEDDDPRFRVLKQVESKASSSRALATQLSTLNSRTTQGVEEKNIVIDEDEEEDEEDVRMRHALARSREIEEPIGPQVMINEYADQQLAAKQAELEQVRSKKVETDDLLKDFQLAGIRPNDKKAKDDAKAEERMKEMLNKVREEATLKAQLLKKIEEDNKRELEKEAQDKGDIGAHDMEQVKTDDEDDELAYEEWKSREYKRVLRDRSERALIKS